ncbi:MAG: helix-turn-helix domain-containing protein [Vicinamibacteria bacterium]
MARPREFDSEETLERAMTLFWERGYEATSVQDLVERTGVNRSSLYSVYGDKQGVFLAALDRYRDRVVSRRLCDLERPDSALAEVRAYFEGLAEPGPGERMRHGCLMTNSAVERAPRDALSAQRIRAHLERLEAAFGGALGRARSRREVRQDTEVEDLARYLTGSAQGLGVMARAGSSMASLSGVVRGILATLEQATARPQGRTTSAAVKTRTGGRRKRRA